MAHAYVSFRIRLARHGLLELAASLRSSAEIILPLFAPVLAALLALAALPPLYAVTLPAPAAAGLLVAHALAMAAPTWLLRQRLMPQHVVAWLCALPVPPRTRLTADVLVACLVGAPLGALYVLSLAVWMWQRPAWIAPASGTLATAASFLLTLCCVAAMLAMRAAPSPAGVIPASARPATYEAAAVRSPGWLLWRRLFWAALWRGDGASGRLLALLFCGALAAAWLWMRAPLGLPRGALALATSIFLIVLADRSDKSRRTQLVLLRPVVAAWPVERRILERPAQWLAAAPAGLVLLVLWLAGRGVQAWQHAAGRWYLALACAAQLLLVAIPAFTPRARVALVALSMLILTAVGSEIWN
jgi:hypothetical protein